MNLSPLWVPYLRAADYEAAHWSAHGSANAEDAEIMAFAREHDFVVVTQDLDFGSILAITHGTKPSVVQLRSADVLPKSIGGRVLQALRQFQVELLAGALLTIDPARSRVRVLPLLSE